MREKTKIAIWDFSEIDFGLDLALLAGAVEYTGCTSAGVKTSPSNECLGYDTKPSDGEASVL